MNTTIKFTLDETDYLTYQLFYASKSGDIKKARKRALNYMVLFVIILVILFMNQVACGTLYKLVVLIVVLIAVIIMPFRLKNTYKKLYLKHTRAVYKNDFGKTIELTFTAETIEAITVTGTSNTLVSQIVEINEIEKYWFLHLQTLGKAFIIPKEKLQNTDETGSAIKEIAKRFNIKYNLDLEWKWR